MTQSTLIMASPDSSASLDVPLIATNDSGEDEAMAGNYSHWKATASTRQAIAAFAAISLLLIGGLHHQGCHYHQHHNNWMDFMMDNSSSTYGMDVSWPIHGSINPRETSPFAPGSRRQAYVQHLQGCRNFYGQRSKAAARTCDTYEFDRILMNKRQPQSMENYTDVGFAKIRAPPRVAKLIQDFWDSNKDRPQVKEAWPEGNIYLNHWDSPSYMVSVDDTGLRGSGYNLKRQIWSAAHATISQWTGGQDITPVSMYGIRVYTNGSVLVPHVDRLPLVASAMVNVAQDVEEDWPMELYDHNGMAHNITLQPGEMLLFESHSVVHGRPFPLKGKFYAMLFIHFEPTGQTPLRQEKVDTDEQYRQAVQDGVGGPSSSEQSRLLPPYIRRFSPEEEHWQREHPEGWRSPASHPASYRGDDDEEVAKEEEPKQQPEEHQAARDGDLAYWMEATQNMDASEIYELVNRRDAHGWQPIHESVTNGREDVVDLLLEYGANINGRTNGGRGGTPLFLAQQKLGTSHPIVRYLVDRGALSIPPDNYRDEL